MGKNYVSRRPIDKRPESDFYETPPSLVWELMKLNHFDYEKKVLEPACGNNAIVNELKKYWKNQVIGLDILNGGYDFLKKHDKVDYIITNPPFSLFDKFVMKAKEVTKEKFCFIGKVNFFGAYQRQKNNIWKNLKYVYIFNRQVDYRSLIRKDGLFNVGNLITGWFIWDLSWEASFWMTSVIDVQKYAKLGQIKFVDIEKLNENNIGNKVIYKNKFIEKTGIIAGWDNNFVTVKGENNYLEYLKPEFLRFA